MAESDSTPPEIQHDSAIEDRMMSESPILQEGSQPNWVKMKPNVSMENSKEEILEMLNHIFEEYVIMKERVSELEERVQNYMETIETLRGHNRSHGIEPEDEDENNSYTIDSPQYQVDSPDSEIKEESFNDVVSDQGVSGLLNNQEIEETVSRSDQSDSYMADIEYAEIIGTCSELPHRVTSDDLEHVDELPCMEAPVKPKEESPTSNHSKRKYIKKRKKHDDEIIIDTADIKGCDLCGGIFEDMEAHAERHKNIDTFSCTECERKFKYKRSLVEHMRTHTGIKPYKCSICGKLSTTLSSHKQHKKVVHPNDATFMKENIMTGDIDSAQSGISESCKIPEHEEPVCNSEKTHGRGKRGKYKKRKKVKPKATKVKKKSSQVWTYCEFEGCQKKFKSELKLKYHIYQHTGVKPFPCEICGQKYIRWDTLRLHRRRMHEGIRKDHVCEVCGGHFESIISHMRTHTGIKNYACDKCDYRCNTRSKLKEHQLVHTRERPYTCSVCDRGIATLSQLKAHMRIHTQERPFKCPVCDFRFTQRGAVRKHMMIHSGEKPFSCDVCSKTFRSRGVLRQHQRSHTGERPYSCPLCRQRFVQKPHRNTHMKLVHKIKYDRNIHPDDGDKKVSPLQAPPQQDEAEDVQHDSV